MRLRHIKIAGFKSFADPVTVDLERPFTGIVGPNGCGKSNIIDAVRWVLGEARVSELRGSSSMKELIFSGSANRKPLGRASVEILLSNEDHRIKGVWGEYAELAIKRVVTLDGQSQYTINGQTVRRRDVLDIFLGTGLGPKSYAVISQGMISSFIKAKPEELRVYLEEAAGVSLYRERRRESEQLIAQTQTNLERVNDTLALKLEEAERLRSEAATAQTWEQLTHDKVQAEALWYFIQYEEIRVQLERLAAKRAQEEASLAQDKVAVTQAETALQAIALALPELERTHEEAARRAHDAEKALTLQESEVRRRQERRQALTEQRQESQARLKRYEERLEALAQTGQSATEHLEHRQESFDMMLEEIAVREEQLDQAQTRLETIEVQTEAARHKASQSERDYGIAKERVAQLKRQQEDLARRLERLSDNERRLEHPDETTLEDLREHVEELKVTQEERGANLEEATERAESAQVAAHQADEDYFAGLAQQKEAQARLDALIQEEKRQLEASQLHEFEIAHGLDGLRRVDESLEVDEQWIVAIDAVLGARSRAAILRLLASAVFTQSQPPAPVAFIEQCTDTCVMPEMETKGRVHPTWSSLREAVSSPDATVQQALTQWLQGYWKADSLAEAMARRTELQAGEYLITPEGHRVSAHGLEYWAASATQEASLARRLAKEKAQETLDTLDNAQEALTVARRQAHLALENAQATLRQSQSAYEEGRRALTQATLALSVEEQKWQAWQQRQADLKRDRADLEAEKDEALARLETAYEKADEAEVLFDEAKKTLAQSEERLSRESQTVRQAQTRLDEKRRDLAVIRVAIESDRRSQQEAEQMRGHLLEDCEREKAQQTQWTSELEALEQQDDQNHLSAALKLYKEAEALSLQARSALETKRGEQQQAMSLLSERQSALVPRAETISQMKVEEENKAGLREQFSVRLAELKADRIALATQLKEDPLKAQGARQRVLKLMQQIEALGPVNHAAAEHLKAIEAHIEATRAQVADLEKAVTTLEEAIRRIDQETRTAMRETFESVSRHFEESFQQLFSGGKASLALVGDDILQAGLEVQAQPPGKRNASLRLLSGGEQALTATALVFALFKLNPAPFCLLDEVDAPLDEANQARLANLCRDQSDQTQFLMITHHRVTMEYVQALIGVTMREPGVSRVVSVDVEEATRLVQTP